MIVYVVQLELSSLFEIVACYDLQVAAMFKIGNSKELPTIPDHLSDEGKDFVRLCLQRNPLNRPTAADLLDHAFVKGAAPLERPLLVPEPSDVTPGVTNGVKALVVSFLLVFHFVSIGFELFYALYLLHVLPLGFCLF